MTNELSQLTVTFGEREDQERRLRVNSRQTYFLTLTAVLSLSFAFICETLHAVLAQSPNGDGVFGPEHVLIFTFLILFVPMLIFLTSLPALLGNNLARRILCGLIGSCASLLFLASLPNPLCLVSLPLALVTYKLYDSELHTQELGEHRRLHLVWGMSALMIAVVFTASYTIFFEVLRQV